MVSQNNSNHNSTTHSTQKPFLPGSGTVDVTFSIVSYNVKDDLRRCLQSIRDCASQLTFQIIVVDNASTDGTIEMMSEEYSDITFIPLNKNSGLSIAINQALALAQGQYIIILNPDTEVKFGAIEAMSRYFDNHPEVGVMGCRLLNSDGSLQYSIYSFPTLRNTFAGLFKLDFTLLRYFTSFQTYRDDLDYDKVQSVEVLLGACIMIPREVFRAIGPMDERYFLYSEETDLCYRVRQLGKEAHYIPDGSIVHHRERSTGGRAAVWRFTRRLQSTYQFFEKFYSPSRVNALRRMIKVRIAIHRIVIALKRIVSDSEDYRIILATLKELEDWLHHRKEINRDEG